MAQAQIVEEGERTGTLTGSWRNQLGSELRLEADGHGGLRGTFRNAVGHSAGEMFPIVGSYDRVPAPHGSTVLAFVVTWSDVHCVTAWSGRYQPRLDTISATWIMTPGADPVDEWRATTVGHDVFRRDGAGTSR